MVQVWRWCDGGWSGGVMDCYLLVTFRVDISTTYY